MMTDFFSLLKFPRLFLGVVVLLSGFSSTGYTLGSRYEPLKHEKIKEDFYFKDETGLPVTLDQYKGRIVVLNLWSIGCGPCVAEMPSLDRLSGLFNEKDLVVIPLNVDPLQKESLNAFYHEKGYKYLRIYQDPLKSSQAVFKWSAIPATYIFNKEGLLIGRQVGSSQWDSEEAIEFFDALVKGKMPTLPSPSVWSKIKGWFGF